MKQQYTIGEVAKLFCISTFSIRFYEKKGLIHPRKDEKNLYRFYLPEHIVQIKAILYLKSIGCSIEEIKTILCQDEEKDETDFLENKIKKVTDDIKELMDLRTTLIQLENRRKRAVELNGKIIIRKMEEKIIVAVFEEETYINYGFKVCPTISQHVLYISKDDFYNKEIFTKMKFGVCIDRYILFEITKLKLNYKIVVLSDDVETDYLYTNFATDYVTNPTTITEMIHQWIKEHGKMIADDVICRFVGITGEYRRNDLYEIWIPLK